MIFPFILSGFSAVNNATIFFIRSLDVFVLKKNLRIAVFLQLDALFNSCKCL